MKKREKREICFFDLLARLEGKVDESIYNEE